MTISSGRRALRLLVAGAAAGNLGLLGAELIGPVASSSAAPTSVGHTLAAGQKLTAGQALTSANGEYTLWMESDGDLVEDFSGGMEPLWSTGTSEAGSYLIMQSDGNLVEYSASGTPLFATATEGTGADELVVGDDGNLVVYAGSAAKWASDTTDTSLHDGETMEPGWYLGGEAGTDELTLQASDGNLVLYRDPGTPSQAAVWATGTDSPGDHLTLQGDGNLVLYSSSGSALWASGTAGDGGDSLVVPPGGGVVISSSSGAVLWSEGAAAAPTGSTKAVQVALAQVGVPYVYGGASPSQGFDCSGLVMYSWGQAGVQLPHNSVDQYDETTRIAASQLQPGDLVFYDTGGGAQPGHVAMFVGNGQVVSANSPGTDVQTQSLGYDGAIYGYGQVR